MPQETLLECLERVDLMADGDPTWDLSDNDRHALKQVLAQLTRLHDERSWCLIESAPKTGEPLLGFMPSYYRNKGGVSVIIWMDGRWFDNLAFETSPSHWMQLPKPPREPGV